MLTYKISNSLDPEVRLEDACMFKALYDASDGNIKAIDKGEGDFGNNGNPFHHKVSLKYWEDPAFLENCNRKFTIVPYEQVDEEVDKLHRQGYDAFVKSGIDKYCVQKVLKGEKFSDLIGPLVYSFIDSPVPLMVQEMVDFKFEHRFFVIDREIITYSPVAYHLTPLDYHKITCWDKAYEYPTDKNYKLYYNAYCMEQLCKKVAENMLTEDVCIDIGMIGNKPSVIELNPLVAGKVGLYACDVRKLGKAIYEKYKRNNIGVYNEHG